MLHNNYIIYVYVLLILLSLSVCYFIYLFIYLPVHLFICPSICLSVFLAIQLCLYIYLSVSFIFIYLFFCPSVFLYICVHVFYLSSAGLLCVPIFKMSSFCGRAFCCAEPKLQNSFLLHIRRMDSISRFKAQIPLQSFMCNVQCIFQV